MIKRTLLRAIDRGYSRFFRFLFFVSEQPRADGTHGNSPHGDFRRILFIRRAFKSNTDNLTVYLFFYGDLYIFLVIYVTCDTGETATSAWVWPAWTVPSRRWWFWPWTSTVSEWPGANRALLAGSGTRTRPDSSPPWRTAENTSVCPPDMPTWPARRRPPASPPCLQCQMHNEIKCNQSRSGSHMNFFFFVYGH